MRANEGNAHAHAPPLSFCGTLAGMAELVDALDSKSSSGNRVGVRFPLPVPNQGMTAPTWGRFHFLLIVQRLNKLEPPPQHSEYLKEAGRRLFRYCVETRNQVQTGKLPAFAWDAKQGEIYQECRKDQSFEAVEREILANPDAGVIR